MVSKETKMGIVYAIIMNLIGGFQPVWANLRPIELDALIFSGMSSLFQTLIFIPIFLIEFLVRRKNSGSEKKSTTPKVPEGRYRLYFGKSKWGLFIVIGLMFSVVMFLYYFGLSLAGSINGTLGLKTTAIFGLLFGFLLLNERINKIQVIFSIILFFGMILAITQGQFYLLQINIGVILILICAAIWMIGHSCTKPYLVYGKTSSSEIIIMRNLFTAVILVSAYFILFGNQIILIFNPQFAYFFIIMGAIYGTNLFFWYKLIGCVDVSIATILITPQLVVTAFFGSIYLGETFTIYHLLGLIIMMVSIVIINVKKPTD